MTCIIQAKQHMDVNKVKRLISIRGGLFELNKTEGEGVGQTQESIVKMSPYAPGSCHEQFSPLCDILQINLKKETLIR